MVKRHFRCKICGETLKNTTRLEEHVTLAHEGKGAAFQCEDCKKVYRYWRTLKDHACKNQKEEFACDKCKKTFYSRNKQIRHIISHTRNQDQDQDFKLQCEQCSKVYFIPSLLARHFRRTQKCSRNGKFLIVSNEPEEKIESFCNLCGNVFETKETFMAHMKKAHNVNV